ncbi:unnamed protein product [Brachionus calyciflorus]|uniref:Nicotinate phosphoribosyltransferase n=1 Tax=Brachionus calyciflorus TaxID=104777 RepID=A0A813RL91_9BILA|nr:unnamed protein product [Brachionus calyciflorus]
MSTTVDVLDLNGNLTNGTTDKSNFVENQSRLTTKYELNNAVQPLLTDLYQLSMAYAYWKNQKNDIAVFDLFFRRNPFQGEYTIFAGLDDCIKYIQDFKFTHSDIEYLKSTMPSYVEEEFFTYLENMNLKELKIYAHKEGSLVFPRIPIMRLEGPLPIVQLLETTLLVLINYASLVTTNASRFRLAAGDNKSLLEFGLRRAQGPDGGLSASKYCYMGGFDGTSNVLAGKLYGIPIKGTHAHSFVSSFNDLSDLKIRHIKSAISGESVDLADLAFDYLNQMEKHELYFNTNESNKGELAAFVGYAIAFPTDFLALVDTYNVLKSGIPNFCAVALALNKLGYKARGIRLDSGDLAYLSLKVREFFKKIGKIFQVDYFEHLTIVASNDINEDILHSLNMQGHSIDSFGIGTHLVTCQKQPALGCVFKLVEVNGRPCVKLSEDVQKATFPGKKNAYRLYDKEGIPLVDLLTKSDEPEPKVGEAFLCRHPFIETKRAYLSPSKVENLLVPVWIDGKIIQENVEPIQNIRDRVKFQLNHLRTDHKRMLNPTPYKITVSRTLYDFIHNLWLDYTPIANMN